MNIYKYKTVISASSLIFGCIFSGAAASASFQSCTGTGYNIADNVTPTTNCTMLTPLDGDINDSVNPPSSAYTANTEAFFGKSDWLFNGKYDNIGTSSGTDASSLFNFSGGAQSGTFDKVGTWSYSDVMFIFKSGGDTNLIGYLIDTSASIGGVYSTPFEFPPFSAANGNPSDKGISHISVYYRNTNGGGGGNTGGQVPEPSIIALMGMGLIGMGVSRLRKTKA